MIAQQLHDDFIALLGKENVILDSEQRAAAAQTNYPTDQQISLILHPADVNELSGCMKLARAHGKGLYVVSRGKNWGYGSKVPVQDHSILIELDRMDRITDYNEELGYITVEPGVTFQQAFDFLREKKSELLLGTTGGPVDSSIIGNALDRGIGTGLYAERISYVCGMEVVLPDGSVIHTGFERFPNSAAGKLSRWGMGPSLDGLFSQSNLGIVTRMTVWLLRCPPYFRIGFYKIAHTDALPAVINRLQHMAMEGLVRPALTVYNDMRVLSCVMQFPFHETQPGEVDPDVLMERIRATSPMGGMVGAWNGEISIRAVSEAHADAQSQLIAEQLRDLVYELSFISVTRDEIIDILDAHYRNPQGAGAPTLRSFLLNKYIGIPANAAIAYAYWRKRTPMPATMDPDGDRCGMFWFSPVVPFRGADIAKAVGIIKDTIRQHQFEPAISLQCISERTVHIIASINWDRDVPGEDEQAIACYEEASRLLREAGYLPYRDSTFHMQHNQAEDAYDELLVRIRKAVDPDNVLSSGKYIPVS